MTKKYCRVCGFDMENPRDITHYRSCVRRKDWPDWVRNGTTPTIAVAATLTADGHEPDPIVLLPLEPEEPEPVFEPTPEGAMIAFGSTEGTLLCECGYLGKDARAFKAHRRTSRLHREPVTA